MLLGNPHFPWTTTNRFYEVHLTVPGKLDVMGASIAAFPVVSIGFNRDVAWTHTVSTGRRFTLFELRLAEGDPTTYLVDGTPHKMTARTIAFDVKLPDGRIERRAHTFTTPNTARWCRCPPPACRGPRRKPMRCAMPTAATRA